MSRQLDQFELSLAPSEPAKLLSIEGDPGEVARWSLCGLNTAPGYVAALVVEGHNLHLTCEQ